MFKKSADLIHLHARTGSHSTKGSARGLDRLVPLGSDDFHSADNIAARRFRLKMIKKSIALHYIEIEQLVPLLKQAALSGNDILRDDIQRAIENCGARLSELKTEAQDIRAHTPKAAPVGRHPLAIEAKAARWDKYPNSKGRPSGWERMSPHRRAKILKRLTKQYYDAK